MVDEARVFGRGGGGVDVGRNCSGEDCGCRVGWGVAGRGRRGEWYHPQASAGAFAGAQDRAPTIGNGATYFREGNLAAGVAERHDRKKGVGGQVGDDVGAARGGGQRWNVQRARVC